ncbi:hypothetical protein [Clostridium perfringens]|uniref:hypothetical protein n=1 Tax=Clostridium perfringens TaxID=1502 RepID=UPI001ABBB5B4|nr:hypothetical protein [Clostridium perfringens]MBO3314521.1 hypothetical protein [Clostridium perfringens]
MAKIDLNKLTYEQIEERYIKYNIPGNYKFQNAEQVKNVFGWDFRTIRGFKNLTEEDKQLAEHLICNYLNGFGLGSRHKQRPTGIKKEKERQRFVVNFKDGYSYLYFNGSIG